MTEHTVFASESAAAAEQGRGREVVVAMNGGPGGHGAPPDPTELLLSAIAAGLLAGTSHAARELGFRFRDAAVRVRGVYTGGAAPSLAVDYDLTIDSDETDGRLVQLHERIRRSESVLRLGEACAHLTGRVRRRSGG